MKRFSALGDWYVTNLSWFWIIPLVLFLAATAVLTVNYAQTGDVIYRDLSLQGGVSLTALNASTDDASLETSLQSSYPDQDINVRTLTELGTPIGVIVEADILPEERETLDAFTADVSRQTGVAESDISIDSVGASLGQQFFEQTMKAVWVAFLFMGACVFYYFGDSTKRAIGAAITTVIASFLIMSSSTVIPLLIAAAATVGLFAMYTRYSIPSIAVILAAFSDILITVAILTFFEIKLGTASIAGLLMLIGYSVDTDILLSTRLIRETEDEYSERVKEAFLTGTTMTVTTLSAITITFLVAQSQTLRQIMLVLMIGLVIDLINTWLQNASILDIHTHWETA